MTYIFLTNIGHVSIDFITLFDQPGKDARCICFSNVINTGCRERSKTYNTNPSLQSRRVGHDRRLAFFVLLRVIIDEDWIKFRVCSKGVASFFFSV